MATDHQNWREQAACRDLKLEETDSIFFLGQGKSARAAREICGSCRVKRQCLNFALYYGESGIWGGMTDEERKSLGHVLGILTRAQVESTGVNVAETREQKSWGLADPQIEEERKESESRGRRYHSQPAAAQQPTFQPLNQQPPMLLIEL